MAKAIAPLAAELAELRKQVEASAKVEPEEEHVEPTAPVHKDTDPATAPAVTVVAEPGSAPQREALQKEADELRERIAKTSDAGVRQSLIERHTVLVLRLTSMN